MMTWLEESRLSMHYLTGEGQGGQKLLYKEERKTTYKNILEYQGEKGETF